ncbi:MAG: hypothetical protein OEZ68_15755, partial [Gammaproteobacteria bacterium]|nr:hypothetical protein [Gammaproteobacteria bacterium]
KRADASGINYIYDYDKTKKQYYTRRTYSSGKILEHWYDSEGEITRRDENGVTVETILREGKKHTHRNELGQTTIREYDNFDNLIKVTQPDNSIQVYTVDSTNSNRLTFTNELGVVTQYDYYPNGQLERTTEALSTPDQRVTEYTYYPNGLLQTVKRLSDAETEEALTSYTYDANGSLSSQTVAVNATTSITVNFDVYDRMGNLKTWRDGQNNTWQRDYDAKGQLKSVTNPLSQSFSFTYDGAGNRTHVYDPYNKLTESRFNTSNRLEKIIDPYLAQQQRFYNAKGQLNQISDEEAKITQIGYDQYGRQNSLTDGAANSITSYFGEADRSNKGQPCYRNYQNRG